MTKATAISKWVAERNIFEFAVRPPASSLGVSVSEGLPTEWWMKGVVADAINCFLWQQQQQQQLQLRKCVSKATQTREVSLRLITENRDFMSALEKEATERWTQYWYPKLSSYPADSQRAGYTTFKNEHVLRRIALPAFLMAGDILTWLLVMNKAGVDYGPNGGARHPKRLSTSRSKEFLFLQCLHEKFTLLKTFLLPSNVKRLFTFNKLFRIYKQSNYRGIFSLLR